MKIRLIIIIDSQTMLLVRTVLFLSPLVCCEGVSKIPSKQAASLEVLEDGNIVLDEENSNGDTESDSDSDEGENIDDDVYKLTSHGINRRKLLRGQSISTLQPKESSHGMNHGYGKESKHHIYGKRHYRDGNQVHVVKTSLKSSLNRDDSDNDFAKNYEHPDDDKHTDNEDTDKYTDSNNMSSDSSHYKASALGLEGVVRNTIGTPTDPVRVIHKDRNTIGTPTDPVRVIHKSSEDSIGTILPATSKSPNAINDTTETSNARNGRTETSNAINDTTETLNARNGRTETSNARNGRTETSTAINDTTETSNARNGKTEDSKAEEHSTGKLLLYIILCLTGIVVLLLVMLCVSKGSGSGGDSPGGDE